LKILSGKINSLTKLALAAFKWTEIYYDYDDLFYRLNPVPIKGALFSNI
jgi:hypothetical protein